jgi:hypothetical protein
MTRSRTTLTALAVVATLLLAACGGGDSESTSDDTASSSVPVEVGGGFDGSREDCIQLSSAYIALVALPAMGFLGDEALAETEDALADLDARVPSELADDYKIIEDAYAEFTEVLDGASMADAATDPLLADRFEEAAEALDSPRVQGAIASFTAFIEKNCSEFGYGDLTP